MTLNSGLDDVYTRGYASVADFVDILDDITISRISDKDLANVGAHLLLFPGVIDEVTEHPEFYRRGFDLTEFYHGVKECLTPKMADRQTQRLLRFRRMAKRYVSSDTTAAKKPHQIEEDEVYLLEEVKDYFGDIDIYDEENFEEVLEGMTLALHCPDLIYDKAVDVFRQRWFSTKQFHADYRWGIKSAEDLATDGRKGMFLEGVANMNHYLRSLRE